MAGVVGEPSKVGFFSNLIIDGAKGVTGNLEGSLTKVTDSVTQKAKDLNANVSGKFNEVVEKTKNAANAFKPEPSPQAAPLATGLGGQQGGRRRRVRKSNKKKKSSNKNKKRSSKRKTKKRVRFSRRVKSRRI